MRIASTIALATLMSTALPGLALAADPITITTSTDAALPVARSSGFDWNGFYAGVHGSGVHAGEGDLQAGVGIHAGVNTQFDFYLLGAEVALTGIPETEVASGTVEGQVLGRAGLVVADNVMTYGAAGYGVNLGAPEEQDVLVGGGVELGLTDSVSVRAQYLHSFPVQGTEATDQFSLGASFHF
ncbi:outer membrane protein [Devosia sediminis]|uniref:Porin family protein n=1 Tax=Devosia sediminis TaxID=2798801 RepID=A0A934IUA4_9HYPH|nr:porin family protein [Devosia sediminis]MBJ3784462.1 porin family protein [Devosia sediminis]